MNIMNIIISILFYFRKYVNVAKNVMFQKIKIYFYIFLRDTIISLFIVVYKIKDHMDE